jgi:hypothetical protein
MSFRTLRPSGQFLTSLEVPNSSQTPFHRARIKWSTSFSSKSELALNLSTDGRFLTFGNGGNLQPDGISSEAGGGGWTKVATFNGTGDMPQNTEPFTVHGGKVRFRFTVKPNDVGPVPFLSE